MADLTVEREVVIEAPADVVWRTITEPDQIARWFADEVELDLREGGAGTLVFEGRMTAPLVVVAVEPLERFSFRWCHPDAEAPVPGNSVLVEFTLAVEGAARTRLRVTETGLDTIGWADEDKTRYAKEHRDGWAEFFGRLEDLFASGA